MYIHWHSFKSQNSICEVQYKTLKQIMFKSNQTVQVEI